MDVNQTFPKLVSAKCLAALLDVSPRTIASWKQQGRLPYIRISSGTIRYDVAEVMAALKERKVAARKSKHPSR